MKNLLLVTVMFFSYSAIFSQLHVSPNGGTDSYVFVTDEILFVEQGVDLTLNPTSTLQASIYLRNNGQLIQGNTTPTANSGTGLLSVQQNAPNDDAWDYTYWCSPVGNPFLGGGSDGNKNFSIELFFEPNGLTDATQSAYTWAHEGFTNPFTISNRWIYTHETPGTEAENNYTWRGHGNTISPGFGFTMKGVNLNGSAGNHNWNYDFRGRPNNGDFTYDVDDGMMTLAGNPYPSAIDLALVISGNPDVGSIWFWDEDRDISGHTYTANRAGYGTWIPVGGAVIPSGGTEGTYTPPAFVEWDNTGGNPGGSGGNGISYQRRFAPIGQGFMLVGNNSTPGYESATIDNSMRIFKQEGSNSDFRGAEYMDTSTGFYNNPENLDTSSGISSNPDNFGPSIGINPGEPDDRWPFLRLVTEFKDSHSREMVLMFHETSTDGYDHGMDGAHPMDATSEAYFPIEGDPYVIQTVPFNIGKEIPIAFILDRQFIFGLEAVEEINFENDAYLWDSLNNTIQKITGGYNAVLNLPAGTYEDRFFIVFENQIQIGREAETIAEETIRGSVDFFQNNNVKQLEVSNPDRYDIASGQIFDMSGKLVVHKSDIGNQSRFTFSTANLSDGVYLVKLTTVDNLDIDYKMVIYN